MDTAATTAGLAPELKQDLDDALRASFNHAHFGIGIAGLDWKFARANDALCQMLGRNRAELCSRPWTEWVIPKDREMAGRFASALLAEKPEGGRELEARFTRRDGRVLWAQIRVRAAGSNSAQSKYFIVSIEDASERILLDAALSESEARFKMLADSNASMMWVTGPQGEVRFVNRAYRTFCGIDEGKAGRRASVEMLIRPVDAPEYVSTLERAIAERKSFRAEATIRLANGARRVIGSTAEPCISPSGEYIGHVGLTADITERVNKEKNRQFEHTLIRAIHDESLEGILVADEAGQIMAINQPFLELWGIRDGKSASRGIEKMTGSPVRPVFLTIMGNLVDAEKFMKRVDELSTHPDEPDYREIALTDGRTIETHSSGLRDGSGQYLGRVWYFRDVTTRKRIEVQLRQAKDAAETANQELQIKGQSLESERRMLRALIDNMPDFMYVKDTESRFIVANAHTARVLQLSSPEELVGKTDADLFPTEMARVYFEDEQALLQSGMAHYNHEETCFDEYGREIKILTTKVPIRDSEGKITGLAGVGRNISDRIEIENALREAERKYRGIFDNAIVGIFQSTPEGRFLSVNTSMALIFGYDSAEEMTSSITDIANQFYVDPRNRDDFKTQILAQGGVQNFECQTLRKDGSKIWISMSVRGIVRDGDMIRYEGMCEDITERKLLRNQLLQAQKLESVGQLAAGIAHEINTPTQYIGDNTQFVKGAFEDLRNLWEKFQELAQAAKADHRFQGLLDEIFATEMQVDSPFLMDEIPRALDQILDGVMRVATLVGAMKEFSHPGTKEKIPIDLNHAIESTITISRNEWKYVADLETDLDDSLPRLPCLPAELNQVILNLIVNAAHAIEDVIRAGRSDRGKITIRTRRLATYAEIRITDTGVGIPAEIRDRVFDPFFTTKEIGKGTGQGLSIAHSVVVDKHGGTIRFETQEGEGTTFILCLPYNGENFRPES